MLTFRSLVSAFRGLGLDATRPVIAHASLSAFGEVQGGAETMLGALLAVFPCLLMPTFTYTTMLIPEGGPSDNGLEYGSGREQNAAAVFFQPGLPADREMGVLNETLRRHARSQRSPHPLLSFAGVNTSRLLEAQTIEEPLAPIRMLVEAGGWVLLLGVGHTANTSIHYAERLAGRKGFLRWALTPRGVIACPGVPGCSGGFDALAPRLAGSARQIQVGQACVQALPVVDLVAAAEAWIRSDPLALLCERPDCLPCQAVRHVAPYTGSTQMQ